MTRALISFLFLTTSLIAHADEGAFGLHCGTRGNLLGTIASHFVIPDYFPPENPLLRLLFAFVDFSECEENYEPAHFGQSCEVHDQCYATLGADKDTCDDDLLNGWLETCQSNYLHDSSSKCMTGCAAMAQIMYAGLRFRNDNFCPSCKAFDRGQERARNRLVGAH